MAEGVPTIPRAPRTQKRGTLFDGETGSVQADGGGAGLRFQLTVPGFEGFALLNNDGLQHYT